MSKRAFWDMNSSNPSLKGRTYRVLGRLVRRRCDLLVRADLPAADQAA